MTSCAHQRSWGLRDLLVSLALAATAVLALAWPAGADAAERTVRLTLEPSDAACTAFEPLDCSYIMTRNGNRPAPDPTDPTAVEPTFLNLANLPDPIVIDAQVADDGTVTIPDGNVDIPPYATTLENALVGTVTVEIQFSQDGDWTGTFDQATGEMSLTAPMGLQFKLACDPASPTLCGAVFPGTGNMGTWQVRSKGPVDPLTTGHLDAPAPPAAYGPDWVPPDAEDGSPYDPGTGLLTLINNTQELHFLEPTDCIDDTSVACTTPAIGELILPPLNEAIGASDDVGTAVDTVPGAIDMRMTFELTEPVVASPTELDLGEQIIGTAGTAKPITLTAPSTGDVPIHWVDTEGGNEDDFLVANKCHDLIPASQSCELRVRFVPEAAGPRSTTVMAGITNPLSGERETIEIARVSGEGVEVPPDPPVEIPPKIDVNRKVKIGPKGKGLVAKVRCGVGRCQITDRTAELRIGKRRFDSNLRGPDSVDDVTAQGLRIALNRKARKRLVRKGRGDAKVTIGLRSATGAETVKTFDVKVRPKAKSRKRRK